MKNVKSAVVIFSHLEPLDTADIVYILTILNTQAGSKRFETISLIMKEALELSPDDLSDLRSMLHILLGTHTTKESIREDVRRSMNATFGKRSVPLHEKLDEEARRKMAVANGEPKKKKLNPTERAKLGMPTATVNGHTYKTVAEECRKEGCTIRPLVVWSRIRRGWELEDAMTRPVEASGKGGNKWSKKPRNPIQIQKSQGTIKTGTL